MRKLWITLLAILPAAPAHAGAVTGWTATDGFGAVPIAKGSSVLDSRVNAVVSGQGVSTSPVLNVLTGVSEGIELGIGTSLLNASGRLSADSVYPWLRAALPLSNETVKTGFMVGGLIPGNGSPSETLPGMTGLIDIAMGPVTTGLNAGYAHGAITGTNWIDANLSVTLPMGAVTFYEEQFVNVPLGGNANGGLRGAISFPLRDKMTLDLSPALLWTQGKGGMEWSFVPNVGVDMYF